MVIKKSKIMVATVGIVGLLTVIGLAVANIAGHAPVKELQMVHIVMRHGIRTPASTYPNDPYVNETFYPTGWGQLTNPGKLLQYNTGKYFKERYGKFLGVNYNPDEFYAQSTDVDRTKASVQLANAGLWPPSAIQKWGPLDWQPVPVQAQPLDQDNLLLVRVPCPEYQIELDKVTKSEEVQKIYKDNAKLFEDLTKITGTNITTFDDVQDIYTTLLAEQAFNLTLPEWTKEYFPEKMEFTADFSYIVTSLNDKLRRLKGGPLLKKIVDDWKAKRDGTISPANRKAFLYGGHDYTIANLLGALKVLDPHVPGYGVSVLLELYKNEANEYSVEIFYRNTTTAPPTQLTLPGCTKLCPLDKLLDLTKDVVPTNWAEECKTDNPDYVPPPPSGPYSLILLLNMVYTSHNCDHCTK